MPVKFQHRTLSNGLTVIAETDPEAHSAAVGFFVKTGARDESPGVMGVSHFLEHMMFKGSADLSAEEINRGFDLLGARNNAYTSHEITCFYAQVLPDKLSAATDLIGRMMRPALRQSDFDTEKQVILEEIAMYADDPFWVLYEETMQRHFGAHPLGHRVLGTKETVAGMLRDQMMAYFEQRYSADNTVVAAAGPLDFDRLCDDVEACCGSWERTGPERDNARPPTTGESFTQHSSRTTRAHILAFADGPSQTDDDRYAAALLGQILGASDNSKLHWALVETGLAEHALAGADTHDGCGSFYLYASCDPDRADKVWDIMQAEIRKLPETAEEDDLARLRAKHATHVTVGGERPGDRMQRLGRIWVARGEYFPLEEELAKVQAVTLADVLAVAEKHPILPCTLGRLMPEPVAQA